MDVNVIRLIAMLVTPVFWLTAKVFRLFYTGDKDGFAAVWDGAGIGCLAFVVALATLGGGYLGILFLSDKLAPGGNGLAFAVVLLVIFHIWFSAFAYNDLRSSDGHHKYTYKDEKLIAHTCPQCGESSAGFANCPNCGVRYPSD